LKFEIAAQRDRLIRHFSDDDGRAVTMVFAPSSPLSRDGTRDH
jgi:hypothetical protein